ncbi:hypothetical protein BH11ARM2_BH11ARM2_00190 [soil metagenome]
MRIPSAGEILALGADDLKMLRSEFTMAQPRELPPVAYFDFLILMTAVQEMREWSKLAEPGMAAWLPEESQAREMDRRAIEAHTDAVQHFEGLGGKTALQNAVDRLNGGA